MTNNVKISVVSPVYKGEKMVNELVRRNVEALQTITDDYEIILKKLIHADQYWVISDTALGFIDHKGKNVFDRILPILTMNLHFVGDQMRHISRYGKNADLGIIYKGDADKEYLERWAERAALNLESRSLGVFDESKIKEAVSCMC